MYAASQIVKKIFQSDNVKVAVRYKKYFARKNRVVDPGIQQRKELIDENAVFEELDDENFDLEADFMNLPTTHKEYQVEQKFLREKQKYLIVKQKYFKVKLPNFLTWSDKLQIRYLHNKDPEEWTLEKLSEGFPALPEVIAKIAKSTWQLVSDHKIRKHDESVKQNWMLFKEGKLKDLPPDVAEHIQKFTNRDLNFEAFNVPEEHKENQTKSMIAPNIKVGSEFSEIIRSYERLKCKDKPIMEKPIVEDNNKLQKPPKTDTYLLSSFDSKGNHKHTTLDALQLKLENKIEQGKFTAEDAFMMKTLQQDTNVEEDPSVDNSKEEIHLQPTTEIEDAINNKYARSSEVSTVTKNTNEQHALDYPDKIRIPKDKYRKGYTYKLNDCYYDDDGEFLYRVPGMY